MAVTPQEFWNWEIHLRQKVKISDGPSHDVWLVPANFNCMRCIKYLCIVPDESEGVSDEPTPQMSPNVIFEEKASSKGDNLRHEAIAVRASRNISPGEELYIFYGPEYVFEQIRSV